MESEYPTPGMLFIPKTNDLLETWVVISIDVHMVDGEQKYKICWLSFKQELFIAAPQPIDLVSIEYMKTYYHVYDHAGNLVA